MRNTAKHQKSRRLLFCLLFPALFSLLLSSCKGVEITGKTEAVSGYTKQEVLPLIISERNRYQNVFGPEIWDVKVPDTDQEDFAAYFLDREKEFLEDIRVLNLMAEEKAIIATSAEMESIRSVSNQFYETLSDEDLTAMGNPAEDDVTTMYTNYFVASKTAEMLLANVNSEVSMADAKVIELEQIVLSDRETADQVHAEVTASGVDFEYYARMYSEDSEIRKTLYHSTEAGTYEQTAFSLDQDEISDVFESDGKYYILKCTNAYDEQATADRKARLENAIRTSAFQKSFQSYQQQHIVRFREPFWSEIDLRGSADSKASGFFELYDASIGSKMDER